MNLVNKHFTDEAVVGGRAEGVAEVATRNSLITLTKAES